MVTTFEIAVQELHDGRCTFDEFARATRGRWQALARYIMRRWRLPPWVSPEDIVQELLLGAWRSIWKYEANRGGSLARYVLWNAVDYAKKRAHKIRGANLHGNADASPSRFEVTLAKRDGDDNEWWSNLLRAEPEQEENLVRKEEWEHERGAELDRALAACKSPVEAYIVTALAASDSVQTAADQLYSDWGMRLDCRLSCEEDAVRVVAQSAAAVAARLAVA